MSETERERILREKDIELTFRIGQTKALYDMGMSAVEIAEKLKKPESSVRYWIKIIEEAKKRKDLELSN